MQKQNQAWRAFAVLSAILSIPLSLNAGAADEKSSAQPPASISAPLPEIVVTATRTEKDITDVPASVQVIDAEAIQKNNPAALAELFRNVAGVEVQGAGVPGAMVRLSLRGLTVGRMAQHVLVLVDGRRVNDAYEGNVEFALMPVDGIERIEILRGPASALYGSNATGGVINIVTRRGAEKAATELKATAGSYGTTHYSVSHGWKTGALDYFLSASRIQTDGYLKNSDGTDRDWTASGADANFGLDLGAAGKLRVFLGGYSGEGTDETSERTARKDYEALCYSALLDKTSDARLTARAYRNAQRDEYDWKFPGKGIYKLETVGAEIQQSLWLGKRNLATIGVESRRDGVDIEDVTGPVDENDFTAAFYAQDELHIGESVELTLGARCDRNGDYGTELSPRAGLLVKVSDKGELFAAVNRAHRAPSLSHRFASVEWNGMQFVGNPDLQPETITSYEIGARQRFGDAVKVEVSAFQTRLDDGFDFMMDPDGVFRARNVSRSGIAGVEAEVQYRVSEAVSAFANCSVANGEYEKYPADPSIEGNLLEHLAKNTASAGLEYSDPKFGAHALSCRYVGRRFGDAQNSPENEMDAYNVADWRSRIPVTPNAAVTVSVANIFDKTYQEYPGVDQPGRTVNAGLQLSF